MIDANLAFIDAEIGGQKSIAWVGMGNTLATAATAPFAGAICDLIGRRQVSLWGLVLIFVGMTVVGTAHSIETAIGGMSLVGVGAGLAEMVAAAGVMELVPVRARGKYIGILSLIFLPICGCQTYG
jgi:MFS family permease